MEGMHQLKVIHEGPGEMPVSDLLILRDTCIVSCNWFSQKEWWIKAAETQN